jgi:hypothetical protein
MIPSSQPFDEQERLVFRSAVEFLDNRLADHRTVEWAAELGPDRRIERAAIAHLLWVQDQTISAEPWATTWRLIEESWSEKPVERGPSTAVYNIQSRLRAGDRSGALISAIVDLVAPRLEIRPISASKRQLAKLPRKPRTVRQLLSAGLNSGELVDLTVLELERLGDLPFVNALATSLESTIDRGLDIARRIGWDGQRRIWQIGDLNRVYYVVRGRRAAAGNEDPDAYNHGIAPSVKLLFEVVVRLGQLSLDDQLSFVRRWRLKTSLVYVRLWAAAALDPRLTTANDLTEFFQALEDSTFWDVNTYPEIAELRARRFGELDAAAQQALADRLLKGPPRTFWPRKAEPDKIRNGRLYWTVRELKRITLADAALPADAQRWVDAKIGQFPELAIMSDDQGYPDGPIVTDVLPNPDRSYDALLGASRLRALETALTSGRRSWNDDPSGRADDWIRQPANAELLLNDLQHAERGGDDFPRVWDRLGWAHMPAAADATGTPPGNLQNEAERVLTLLAQLSDATTSAAVQGLSAWLEHWRKQVVETPLGLTVWFQVWPAAVAATNAQEESEDRPNLSTNADPDREPKDLDTLNAPAGKLVSVFLAGCGSVSQQPFANGAPARQMRDEIISAPGRTGLIVRHRLIERIPYFLEADRAWAEQNLVAPLLGDDGASLTLWRAVARATRFTSVLEVIGSAMAERATDKRLGRATRGPLVFSLVVEALHAFREHRAPAIPYARIQQMLRILDDEVRATAANAVQMFVQQVAARPTNNEEEPTSTASLFLSAARPFLREVWPQERSLATPGVSKSFADLPATTGEAFTDAAGAIERFLVPFDGWSMLDYGLYGEESGVKKLSMIDDTDKAAALLRLLDLTISSADGAVTPLDLTDALDQIYTVAPQLSESPVYRRLSTAARR